MAHTMKITMLGFYAYDPAVFDELSLPAVIDKDEFINAFLLDYGEFPVLYTDLDFMKFAIGIWSKKWYKQIERIGAALTEDYNPIHNYDRHEEYTDTETEAGKVAAGFTSGTTNSGTTENQVSAFNASAYQPDTKEITNNKSNVSGTNNEDRSNNRNLTHDAHLYGNIGVTTSQEMLDAEIDLRKKDNLLHIVSEMLFSEICIYTY